MPDIALRPRSPTELVDAAFQLYRAEPVPFITAMALIYVPWQLIIAMSGMADIMTGTAVSTTGSMDVYAFSIRYFTLSIGGLIAYLLSGGITTRLASDVYLGRPIDLVKALRAVVVALIALLVSGFVAGFAILIGLMLFIIPGFYIYGRLFATKQTVLLEGAGPLGAVGRSWSLTKGHVAHVLGTMALIIILIFVVSIGAGMVSLLLPQSLRILIGTAVAVFIYPMIGITETLLYYDVRIRREGFDIEYLAAAAPSPPPAEGPAA